MRKRSLLLIILLVFVSGCGRADAMPSELVVAPTEDIYALTPTPAPTPTPEPTPEPMPEPTVKPISPEVLALLEQNEAVWAEKARRYWMAGRLIIPSVNIDVALFINGEGSDIATIRQNVCDAEDSAILYNDTIGNVIADHSNQAFAPLPYVNKGDAAYILEGDCILSLKCEDVMDGINTGEGLTDLDGMWLTANYDIVCYTCGEDWTHIKAAGFMITDADYFDTLPITENEQKNDGK